MITADTLRLLAAIRVKPDEDTPRLALADELQDNGHEDAAEYLRDNMQPRTGERRASRTEIGNGYLRWLGELFGLPPWNERDHWLMCAGATWDSFCWRDGEAGGNRRCELHVVRGLPHRLVVTCPMLMERARQLFLFPLTQCVVTGRTPERDPIFGVRVWNCRDYPQRFSTWEESPEQIPKPIYELLSPGEWRNEPRAGRVYRNKGEYGAKSLAHEDLNRAALAFGRRAVENHTPEPANH